jgi:hypothetical protein
MSNGAPRHLAAPVLLRRRWRLWTGVGLAVLLNLTVIAWVGTTTGSRGASDADRRPANRSEAASQPTDRVTATTGAVTTTTAKASGDGPRNLLPNASFEGGSQGWRPIGGARLERSTEATAGGWSLRILAGPSADGPVGIAVPAATVTKVNGRYHTNAWVRPSAPGTTVTIGLREYRQGRPVPGSNTLGWTVEGSDWRRFGAIHAASVPGSQLALEIMARDLPPGGYLEVDDVVLHLLRRRS